MLKNKLTFKGNNLNVDLAVNEDKTVVTLMKLLLENKEVKPIHLKSEIISQEGKSVLEVVEDLKKEVKPKPNIIIHDTAKKSLNIDSFPPVWLIECEECNTFATINIKKNENGVFTCRECGEKTTLSDEDLVVAKYKCECGTEHRATIHSLSNIINTKCRSCEMPIDLKWNENKKEYYKL